MFNRDRIRELGSLGRGISEICITSEMLADYARNNPPDASRWDEPNIPYQEPKQEFGSKYQEFNSKEHSSKSHGPIIEEIVEVQEKTIHEKNQETHTQTCTHEHHKRRTYHYADGEKIDEIIKNQQTILEILSKLTTNNEISARLFQLMIDSPKKKTEMRDLISKLVN